MKASSSSPSSTDVAASGTTDATTKCVAAEEQCSLRSVAEGRDLLIGVAADPARLTTDDHYAEVIAKEFNSVTAENAMKWPSVHPAADRWNFGPADQLMTFAKRNGIAVRGHTLVWGQSAGNGTPDWVNGIDDPATLQSVLAEHITRLVGRYRGRIDRWDVVNEPLQSLGTELDPNHFLNVLGPDYIALAFRLAHEADPEARLYLNENMVEHLPSKAAALLALLRSLIADRVPIHGVGIQTHQFTGTPPAPGEITRLVASIRELGLDVALTELDVPVASTPLPSGDEAQASAYRQIVSEALKGGCHEVTIWGLDDGHTWLDAFLGREGTDPLLFDREYRPKSAYGAVREVIADGG